MWKHNTLKTTLILMPLSFAFAVALDLYIPAVPQLVTIFQSTPAQIQLTLSGFMLAFGIGQLFVGPYTDQFGRRPVALISAILYLLSSLLCATSDSVTSLVVYRIIQALSACGMLVCANAVVRDVYSGTQSAKMYSYLNCAIAMSPLFAPLIGGYVDVLFGWRACFITLGLFGLMATGIVLLQLHETHPTDKRTPVNRHILKRYWHILQNRDFRFYAFVASCGIVCLFTFFSTSPYILIQDLHVERQRFGLYFGVMGLLFLIGSLMAAKTVVIMGLRKNILLGASLILVGGLWMWLASALTGLSAMGFICPMIPISLGAAFVTGAGAAGAMEPFPDMAGAAAALYGSAEFILSSIIGNIVLQFYTSSALPLALTVSIVGMLSLVYWFIHGLN